MTTTNSLEAETRVQSCAVCGTELIVQKFFFEGREWFTGSKLRCTNCAEQAENLEQECQKRNQAHKQQAAWEHICPVRFRNSDPARIRDQQAMNQIIGWKLGPNGLLALGPTGAGKTRCFYMLLHRLHFKEKRSIIALNSADFSLEVGRLFFIDQVGASGYVKQLCTEDVLYIDDLDKARFTDRTEAAVYHVINSRTEHGKPILASVNSTGDELADLLSENRGFPIVRRLRDYCKGVTFK